MAFIGEDNQSEVKKILKDYGFHFDKNLPRTKTVTYKHQNDEKRKVFWYYTKGKFLFQGKGFNEPSFIPSNASELVNKLENLINPQSEKRKTFESIETHLIKNSPGPSETPKEEKIQKMDQCTTMGGKLMEVETKQFELVGGNEGQGINNNRSKDRKRKAGEAPEDPVDSIPFKKPREDEMLFKGRHHQPDVERIINTYGFHLNKTEESKMIFKNEENHTLSWFFTKGKFMIQGRGFSQPTSHNFSEVINMIENLKNQEKEEGKSKLLEGKETPLMKMEHLKDDNSFAMAHNVCKSEAVREVQKMVTNVDRIKHEQLTDEQKDVWEDVLSGRNVFLTGPAGTGKSFVFKYFIQELADLHGEIAVAVTAPTGVAAINVNGMTIHSFAGVGLGEEEEEELFQKILTNSRARSNWSRTKVLMIDEVSMIGSELFTKLANIGGRLKALEGKSSLLPFGGIQVILCGDFFQLPPVMLGSESVGGFAFSSPAWKQLNVKTWQLTQVVRPGLVRQNDPEFIGILNTLRSGNVNQSIVNRLETCQLKQKPLPEDGIIPTKLMCTNKDVDAENHQQLKKLDSEEFVLEARDKIFDSLGQYAEKQLREGIENKVQKNITVKLEAQVVLIRNIDVARKLVNGTRGVVVGFKEEDLKSNRETEDKMSGPFLCPIIKWDCGITEPLHPRQFIYRNPLLGTICRDQVPLKLAWALTVHKSQGITLSRAQIKVDNAFENGQVYVALSRCISLDGLSMTGASLSQRAVMAHPEVIEFYKQ